MQLSKQELHDLLNRFIEAFKESLCEVPENQKITRYFRPK